MSDDSLTTTDRVWSARASRFAWAIVGVGAALRVARYLADRSLWLDEAYLAESVLTYSFKQLLTQPLLNWQAAPAGFLVLQKGAVTLFGTSEYALRLVPMLAGVASVPMFRALVRRFLPAAGGLASLALFATLEPLVYYTSEAKQYALDATFMLWITLAALRVVDRSGRVARWVTFGAVSAVAMLTSHPAVFVVATTCVFLIFSAPRVPAIVASVTLFAFFVANYALFLRPLTHHAGLEAYWADAYVPSDRTLPLWLWRTWRGIFANYGSMWLPLPEAGVVLSTVGLVQLAQRDRRAFAICILPAFLTLAAAALHRYPFSDRLALFLVPGAICSLGAGVDFFIKRGWRVAAILALVVVFAPTIGRALFYAAFPPGREEMRTVLARMRDVSKPDDSIYAFHLSDVPFRYYRDRFGMGPDRFNLAKVRVITGGQDLAADLKSLRGRGRVCVLLTHTAALGGVDEKPVAWKTLCEMGEPLDQFEAKGAVLYRFYLPPEKATATTRPAESTAGPSSRPR